MALLHKQECRVKSLLKLIFHSGLKIKFTMIYKTISFTVTQVCKKKKREKERDKLFGTNSL